jgi:hypothetical protein
MAAGEAAWHAMAGATFAHCEMVGEQPQSWPQHDDAWSDGPDDRWVCGPFVRQHLLAQQFAFGVADSARAAGANTPSNERTSKNLAVRRGMANWYSIRDEKRSCKVASV